MKQTRTPAQQLDDRPLSADSILTIRQEFARSAMQGMLSRQDKGSPQDFAELGVQCADALLEALVKYE